MERVYQNGESRTRHVSVHGLSGIDYPDLPSEDTIQDYHRVHADLMANNSAGH